MDKGTGYFGVLFSYSKNVKENVKNLLENTKYSTAVSTSTNMAGGYFFKRNFAVGMGVTYNSKKDDAETINTFGPNTLSNAELYSWYFSPFIRNYFPVGQRGQFYIFAQTGLEYGFGNGNETNTTGSEVLKYEIKDKSYGVAFTPGMIFLVEQGFAFELNVGVVGLEFSKNTKTSPDPDILPITVKNTQANLDINLLKLNLGLSYYF